MYLSRAHCTSKIFPLPLFLEIWKQQPENNILKWNMASICVDATHGPVFKSPCLTPVHVTGQDLDFFLDVKLNWIWKGRMKYYFCSDRDYGKSKTVLFQY